MVFSCAKCGYEQKKWAGKCPECGEWNSMIEAAPKAPRVNGFFGSESGKNDPSEAVEFGSFSNLSETEEEREKTETEELDNTLGGGFVKGSVVLMGGEPGIGKSTMLLQILAKMADKGKKVFYVSGEESLDQISIRAKRLGITESKTIMDNVFIASTGSVSGVLNRISQEKADFLFIDSIQTMFVADVDASIGAVAQVKFAAAELISFCKSKGIILVLVGHVTKEGNIAGPKILEHMVDVVVYFESSGNSQFRILRSVKNRFGPTNEVGLFIMEKNGLKQIKNPSSFFTSKNKGDVVFVSLEGTKPVLVAVESLIAKSYLPSPKRSVVGWDYNRASMILAIMQTHCNVNVYDKDIYLNMAGGFKTVESANDLAILFSLMLSVKKKKLNHSVIILGEVALSGDVRMIANIEPRINEAKKLGYTIFVLPKSKQAEDFSKKHSNLKVYQMSNIEDLEQVASLLD